jgi:hypothetical protein
MSDDPNQLAQDIRALKQRIELLERENDRLRRKMEPLLGPDNPCFDTREFMRVMRRTLLVLMAPMYLMGLMALVPLIAPRALSQIYLLSIPLLDFAGQSHGHPGIGLGWIAFGGVSAGALAIGGMSIGLIALGGGSIGVIAFGGGSLGIIAIGGGACGFIALGGGACGYYALGHKAAGRYALGINRQDPEAIAFFGPWIPGLRRAVTMPMPVIPLEEPGGR